MKVVDASVLVDAATRLDRLGETARKATSPPLAVPDVAFVEALSGARRQYLAGEIDERRFDFALTFLRLVPAEVHPSRLLLIRAAELSHSVTAYDAIYVALAEAIGAPLLTRDVRLAAAHGPQCEIRVLG